MLKSLSGSEYLATPGTNSGFLLKHCVDSLPHKTEIDVPLVYADYYFLEALLRYHKIEGKMICVLLLINREVSIT
jgi:hypothetical protein